VNEDFTMTADTLRILVRSLTRYALAEGVAPHDIACIFEWVENECLRHDEPEPKEPAPF